MTRHASLHLRCAECRAGSPPRRAGNFLLRRQKKVTKEEALNRTRSRRRQERRAKTFVGIAPGREPLRSRCCPYDECDGARFTPPNVGCTPNSPGNTASLGRRHRGCARVASPERRCICISREHGVQPRVRRDTGAMGDAGDKDSSESEAGRVFPVSSWLLPCASKACGDRVRFSASSLVTFFWRRRRKPKVSAKPKLPARRGGLPAPYSARRRGSEACLTRPSGLARRQP